jgi:hypothetical protein
MEREQERIDLRDLRILAAARIQEARNITLQE